MKCIPVSLILICSFVFGGLIFKITTPLQCDNLSENDSVFVLTGDQRRIPFAIKKISNLKYSHLYIIGAGATEIPNIQHVYIETESKSTYQNALAIKQIAEQELLNRIVVVTTEDHINRAIYLLKEELPNVNIVACPATLKGMPVHLRLQRWLIEYVKYIATMFGIKES
ncbi:MAG: YdcF family protein [Alphaproteobacteria bacterium]|nr:YdcF family protein [Alphaproteobacteria bacterium]